MWSQRISDEFNQQIDKEKELGLPILAFMLTPDNKTFYKNEMGFASFVVAPMWRALTSIFTVLEPIVQQLDKNIVSWKQLIDENTN